MTQDQTNNSNDAADQQERRRPIGVWTWLFIAAVALLIAALIWHAVLAGAIRSELDKIRADGYPATPDELDAWYTPVPDGETNAATVILDAMSLYSVGLSDDEDAKLPVLGDDGIPLADSPPDAEALRLAQRVLDDNATVLAELHRGATLRHARCPTDLSEGFMTELHHISPLREASSLLLMEAVCHAHTPDAGAATRSLRTALATSRTLQDEPILISMLVTIAIQKQTCEAAEYVISRTSPGDKDLVALMDALAEADRPDLLTRAMAGERACGSDLFDMSVANAVALSGGSSRVPVQALMAGYTAVGLKKWDHLTYLDLMRANVDASTLPTQDRPAAFSAVESRITAAPQWSSLFTQMVAPAVSGSAAIHNEALAKVRATRIGLAIERHRLAESDTPAALVDLVPRFIDALPADPFTGKDMLYDRRPDGFAVYSVGADGVDDGGGNDDMRVEVKRVAEATPQP